MSAAVILSMPIACLANTIEGTGTAARSGHPAFQEAVWIYYRDTHPACGMKTDAALAAKVATRDKRFRILSARIAASPLAGEFRRALDDAQKRQANIMAVIDCAAPTVAGSWTIFNQSFVALDRLESAWRDASKGRG